MALQARSKHEDYYYYQDISSLDESVIQDARRSFDKLRASGTLRADSFESNQWIMTDGVRPMVTIDFQVDEVAFSRTGRQLLGCTLNDYQQAMRVATCCWFGYSLDTLQDRVGLLRRFACGQYEITQYEDAQIMLDMLFLLPGYSLTRKKEIRKLESIQPNNRGKESKQRSLANYQSYIRFDFFLNRWWDNATAEDRVRYFPVYFWWKVTAVLPLRPRECTLTPRNCIRKEDNRWFLTVRRTTLKGTRQAEDYRLEEDYKKMEYPIPEELGAIIEQYITATESAYNPSIDTLFCKHSQFSLLDISQKNDGYYGYPNLLQCLNHFYNDILIGQFGLTVVEGCDSLSSPEEIERIHLGDTRHIAMVSLMLSGGSPSVCRALADHEDIDISSNYYTNVESFLKATSREGYRPNRRESSSDKNDTTNKALRTIDRTMKINGGYCQSKLAQSGNFSDCAWKAAIYHRSNGRGCPYCSGKLPIAGKTDFATVCKNLLSEWDYEKNKPLEPEEITPGSGKRVFWKCENGHSWKAAVYSRVKGNGCSKCRYKIE